MRGETLRYHGLVKPRVLKVDLPGDPEREREFELDCLAEMTVEERYASLFEMVAVAT